jgi:hypothetical protein
MQKMGKLYNRAPLFERWRHESEPRAIATGWPVPLLELLKKRDLAPPADQAALLFQLPRLRQLPHSLINT